MLLKEESRTALVIYFLHWMHWSFFLSTSSVKHPPQNLWLQGWTLTGIHIISKQKEQVIWSLIDAAKLPPSSFFLSSFLSFYFFSFAYFCYFYSSSFFLRMSLKPKVSSGLTLVAGRSQIYERWLTYFSFPLPILSSLMKVPFVLVSTTKTPVSLFSILQCFPLRRLSLIITLQSGFRPTITMSSSKEWSVSPFDKGYNLPQRELD